MNNVRFTDRIRYAFDNTMSKGTIALIGWLALTSIAIILVVSLVVQMAGVAPEGIDFLQILWMSLMRTLDAGTMGGDQGPWAFLLAMLTVTLGGIFVISTLIGVLTTGIENKLEELRKGRSRVIETDHTVILGWSEQVFSIIAELVIANANRRQACIVILGDKDKVEMEDEIRDKVGNTGHTRIVCRTGSPMDMADLQIVSLDTARAIIILSPEEGDPDASVIKTMLAITNNPNRRPQPYHIVAEIHDPKNMEVARMIGRDEVELILAGDLIARIIAQTCRQSGLSVIYNELLDFGGDEIYFKAEPALTGKTLGEALLAYEDSTVIGLKPKSGDLRLNPPLETRLQDGDQIIAISQDDDTIRLSGRTDLRIKTSAIQEQPPVKPQPERTLILGWNWRAPTIITELDHYVAPGSTVTVVANVPDGEAALTRYCSEIQNQKVTFRVDNTTDRRVLDDLDIASYQHVILLCYDTLEPQKADACTLITLLHLRDIADRYGHPFSIVSEILDMRDRKLAEVTRADDFIVSNKLVSLILSQVAENKALNAVFLDLFGPEGSEIYLKPALNYVKAGEPVNFYTVVEAARRRGEIAIGYRLLAHAGDASRSYGVVINPDKSAPVIFSERDRVVVLAEQ